MPARLTLLKSRKAIDRRAAALALGKIGSAEAMPALQAALRDKDAVVQRFAFEALEWSGSWRREGLGDPALPSLPLALAMPLGRCATECRRALSRVACRDYR